MSSFSVGHQKSSQMFSVFNAQHLKARFEDQTDQKWYTSIHTRVQLPPTLIQPYWQQIFFFEITIFIGKNWCKNKWSPKKKNGLQFLNFLLENCVLQNKKVFSQSSWLVYTFSVFGRLGFDFWNCPLFGL